MTDAHTTDTAGSTTLAPPLTVTELPQRAPASARPVMTHASPVFAHATSSILKNFKPYKINFVEERLTPTGVSGTEYTSEISVLSSFALTPQDMYSEAC
ncbi:hypothetical protein EVAR_95604_1 [Eumeta japonica]|uniref:Uncharacterized protein n=1 Tax=Eumeta variegata TaxID=151549 RepID=A0A4C1VM80_EUMVA|nr:hypothetical protein EVAR_95604_1 [Eumeta japonica]